MRCYGGMRIYGFCAVGNIIVGKGKGITNSERAIEMIDETQSDLDERLYLAFSETRTNLSNVVEHNARRAVDTCHPNHQQSQIKTIRTENKRIVFFCRLRKTKWVGHKRK